MAWDLSGVWSLYQSSSELLQGIRLRGEKSLLKRDRRVQEVLSPFIKKRDEKYIRIVTHQIPKR